MKNERERGRGREWERADKRTLQRNNTIKRPQGEHKNMDLTINNSKTMTRTALSAVATAAAASSVTIPYLWNKRVQQCMCTSYKMRPYPRFVWIVIVFRTEAISNCSLVLWVGLSFSRSVGRSLSVSVPLSAPLLETTYWFVCNWVL